jgi:YesN/AraC family two-component response regulator
MIRVVVADDHHLVRQGLRALLETNPEVEVVGEAATGYEAVELAGKLQPDVIVMDLSMPRLDGVQAASRILDLKTTTQVVIV